MTDLERLDLTLAMLAEMQALVQERRQKLDKAARAQGPANVDRAQLEVLDWECSAIGRNDLP